MGISPALKGKQMMTQNGLERYRAYIHAHIEKIRKAGPEVRVRDFTDEELREFIGARLTENQRRAVELRFSEPFPTLKIVGEQMGVRRERVRQLLEESFNRLMRPESGFRTD